jgi:hypothetical protein
MADNGGKWVLERRENPTLTESHKENAAFVTSAFFSQGGGGGEEVRDD